MHRSDNVSRRACLAGVASAALLPRALLAASSSRQRAWPDIQEALQELVAERAGAGLGVAIAYGDRDPAYLSAGTLAFNSDIRFGENSICRIYSMTKNITRIATLLLVEDGKLSLDQPVTDVLPEFRALRVAIDVEKSLDARPVTKTMTMRHLITNTSGLGNWTPGSDSGEDLHRLYRERGITPGSYGTGRSRPEYGPPPASLEELITRVAELPLAYEPGTRLHYSIGFDVMALVIERVTGMDYGAFLDQRLFAPLRMRSTGFQVARRDAARLTTNYDATGHGLNSAPDAPSDPALPPGFRIADDRLTSDWLKPPLYPAGGAGLVSTTHDFLRYARMLLNEGVLDKTRVMKPETARLATGNINPPDIAEPSEGVGAGSRALLLTPLIPAGTQGVGGAAGTLFWIDRKRNGAVVFMAQAMWGSPARSPYQKRLFAAIERDLAAG